MKLTLARVKFGRLSLIVEGYVYSCAQSCVGRHSFPAANLFHGAYPLSLNPPIPYFDGGDDFVMPKTIRASKDLL